MSVCEQREESLGELSPSLIPAAIPQQQNGFGEEKEPPGLDFEKYPMSLHAALGF